MPTPPFSSPGLAEALQIWPYATAHDAIRYLLTVTLVLLGLAVAARLRSVRWGAIWQARQVRIRPVRPGQRRSEWAWSMHSVLVFGAMGSLVWLGWQRGLFRILHDTQELGWGYALASLVLLIVLHDTWFYWTHRLLHLPRLMRWAHARHHRSLAPTPWAAYSFGTLDALINALYLPCVLWLMPLHEGVILIWGIHQTLRNALGHCGVEVIPLPWLRGFWGRWFTTTLHHEMHHAYSRGNYGLYFRWWDVWCGTEQVAYAPALNSLCAQIAAAASSPVPPAKPLRRPPLLSWLGSTLILALGLLCAVVLIGPKSAFAQTPPMTSPSQSSLAASGFHPLLGEWATQGHGSRVRLRPCEGQPQQLCGTVVWLWEPLDKQGKAMLDAQNPNPALSQRPLIGVDILTGFRLPSGPAYSGEGRIYNPEDGRTYTARMRLRNADTLELEGCVLLFCAKQIWRKMSSVCTSSP